MNAFLQMSNSCRVLAYSKYQKEKKAEKKEGWLTDKEVEQALSEALHKPL